MGMAEQPGSSEDSNLSGQQQWKTSFEAAVEAYYQTASQDPQDPFSGSLFDDVPATDFLPDNDTADDAGTEPSPQDSAAPGSPFFAFLEEAGLLDEDGFLDEETFLEILDDSNYQARLEMEGCSDIDADGEELRADGEELRAAAERKAHLNVLWASEPLTMPNPVTVAVYGGTKRVQRMLPPMTAQQQANYIPWTPELGNAALDAIDPATLTDNQLLDYIQATERQASWVMARQAAAINEFSTRRPPVLGEEPPTKHPDRSRYAAAELMALFGISPGTAEQLIADAELLVQSLPDTYAEYAQGNLDTRRIKAIIRGTLNTPPEILHDIENKFLVRAMNVNPNALTRKVRNMAERHNPEPLEERHKRARTDRAVWLSPLPDGMALLGARLPATDATLLFNSLDEWARAAKQNGDPSHGTTPTGRPSRSLHEYRADILLDLLHQVLLHPTTMACNGNGTAAGNSTGNGAGNGTEAGSGSGSGTGEPFFNNRVPAVLNITVSAETLLGKSGDPAILEGYGPIPIGDPHEFAATAKAWRRFLTDPDTGRITSIGRKSRKPPKSMAREVRQRDPVCTGIGCDRPARSCDLDHTTPFNKITCDANGIQQPPGHTSLENLRPRCPYCHHVKDDPHTGWTVENISPGVTKTTTPTGRVYLQTQGDIEAPF